MEPDLQQRITEQPDGVLCEILTHRDEYTPEAVRAAEEEVRRKGVRIPAVRKEEKVVDDGKGMTIHKDFRHNRGRSRVHTADAQ